MFYICTINNQTKNIMQKSIKDLAEQIELTNEAFASMTKREKKVQIAEDCIARIEIGQLQPYQGAIVSSPSIAKIERNYGDSDSLKDVLNRDIIPCDVCAKGGLFLSYVGRTNDFQVCDFTSSSLDEYNSFKDSEHKKLLEIFTAKELAYIEFAFEGKQMIETYKNGKELVFSYDEYNRVKNFFHSFHTSNSRLIAICENIVKNKGTFRLGKEFNNK